MAKICCMKNIFIFASKFISLIGRKLTDIFRHFLKNVFYYNYEVLGVSQKA